MDNALIGYDQFHTYVMPLGRNRPIDQLKIVAQSNQMCISAGMLQEPVIITLAVTDTMPVQIKGNTGNNDQVGFIRQVITAGRAGFQNTEGSLGKTPQSLNLAKDHPFITDSRIQYPLTGRKGLRQNIGGIGLVVGRRIQGDTLCPCKFLKSNEPSLGDLAGCPPLFVIERPASGQNLLAERAFGHRVFFYGRYNGILPGEVSGRSCREGESEEWLVRAVE